MPNLTAPLNGQHLSDLFATVPLRRRQFFIVLYIEQLFNLYYQPTNQLDLVVPVAASRDWHGSGQLYVMELGPGRQMSQEDISRKLILKLIIYFAPLI